MNGRYIKDTIRGGIAFLHYYCGMPLSALRGKVLILTYHRVLAQEDLQARYIHPAMYVLNDVFQMHMQYLKEKFEVVPIAELLERWQRNDLDKRKRYCVITFDDGWRDNYVYAYPVLKQLRLPATVFLATDFIGTTRWFWPERLIDLLEKASTTEEKVGLASSAIEEFLPNKCFSFSTSLVHNSEDRFDSLIEHCKRRPYETIVGLIDRLRHVVTQDLPEERLLMTWEEARDMSQDGISFGSHSCTHRIMTTLPLKEVQEELAESRLQLLQNKLNYVPVFCYPNGNYNRAIQDVVRDFYQAALSTRCGAEGGTPEDLFAIRRVGMHNDIASTLPLFSLRLS